MPPAVVVSNLRKRYGAVTAADGVSFEIQPGEIFGLIGPNGAGKTTTVECLVGLRQPDEGRIEVCGLDARRRPRDVKRHIGAALQTTALQDRITPREALDLFSAFYGNLVPSDQLLQRFGLLETAGQPFDTLSGGQKQRLALALAFVNNPDVVVLDEPTAGLDPRVRRDLRHEIARMRDDGRTVLLTTHDLEEAELLCDRVAIINRGRIVATGVPRELTTGSTAMPSVSVSTTPALPSGWLDGVTGLEGLTYDAVATRFRTSRLGDALAAILVNAASRNAEVSELHVQKATLEDVVIELTSSRRDH
jgi:ABC-2 type transport system ATP-binding protein